MQDACGCILALDRAAPERGEAFGDLLGFDAFGHDREAELVA